MPQIPNVIYLSMRDNRTPIETLYLAVLEQAMNDLRKIHMVQHPRDIKMVWETVRWFCSDDIDYAFSFISICNALKLNPNAVKEAIADELNIRYIFNNAS